MRKIILIIAIVISFCSYADVTLNCIMVYESPSPRVVKESVSLKSSDSIKTLNEFGEVVVTIEPHAVANIENVDNILSYKLMLTSVDGYTSFVIGDRLLDSDGSTNISLSNNNWSLITECYKPR